MSGGRDGTPSIFDRKDPHPERRIRTDPAQKRLLKALDEGLTETFPASDPPSVSQPTTPGARKKGLKARG
ncbi:MAG: hypothetical protein IPL88_11110 [Rhizobiales bacterium]|nr:hypothetical protein [Hyphomicrobiales bacterium]